MNAGTAEKRKPPQPSTPAAPVGGVRDERPVFNDSAPGQNAALFEVSHYAGRGLQFTHREWTARSAEPRFSKMRFAVKADILKAQVYRFLESGVDMRGRSYNPTPARVRALIWALAARCQTGVPHPAT